MPNVAADSSRLYSFSGSQFDLFKATSSLTIARHSALRSSKEIEDNNISFAMIQNDEINFRGNFGEIRIFYQIERNFCISLTFTATNPSGELSTKKESEG
jgi:hypothetical protein